jgi:hypothetical protein
MPTSAFTIAVPIGHATLLDKDCLRETAEFGGGSESESCTLKGGQLRGGASAVTVVGMVPRGGLTGGGLTGGGLTGGGRRRPQAARSRKRRSALTRPR